MPAQVSIETERLHLRTVTLEDVEGVISSWNLDGERPARSEAIAKINWMQENHQLNRPGRLVHLCLAIIYTETREFIGWCGLDQREKSQVHPVLFYLLKSRYWGKGLATEAARAVLAYGFEDLGLARIDSGAAHENLASRRVMEKIGMRYVGLSEDGGYRFTLTKIEYDQSKMSRRRS